MYTFEMFEFDCKRIANIIKKNKKIKYIVGIKRGGYIPAVRISHLTGLPLVEIDDHINPNEVAIIDEVLDSGRTRQKYEEFENFYVLVDKQKQKIDDWIVYWWEEK